MPHAWQHLCGVVVVALQWSMSALGSPGLGVYFVCVQWSVSALGSPGLGVCYILIITLRRNVKKKNASIKK